MGFFVFFFAYLLGGITFIPLLIAGGIYYINAYHTKPYTSSLSKDPKSLEAEQDHPADPTDAKNVDEKFLSKLKNEPDIAAGYFAVTREWTPGGINGKPPERMTPVGVKGEEPSQSMYQTVVRSIFDRRPGANKADSNGAAKKKRAPNVFYVVLRHGHLMLYDDQDQQEVRHVISLSHHIVSIYGGGEKIPEGELYIRRNAIALTRKDGEPAFNIGNASLSKPFYLFSENCSEKEDFYFALLRNQEKAPEDTQTTEPPSPLGFDPAHLILLVQQLHSSEEHLQTRWINAILGRVFLALYKTPDVENFFKSKITKKIARVKKPGFLSDICIQKVNVGDSVPYITNPRLRDLNVKGECVVEANVSYTGNFSLEIFTAARIDLGARFKTREVDLVLAAVLKKLEGKVIIRIKAPPSNRIWVAFETMPKMELEIEPIVSTRSITYRPLLQLIESRVREVVMETLVLPHYDDLPFTDTINQLFRGGIWKDVVAAQQGPSNASEPALVTENDRDCAVEDPAVGSPDMKSMSMPNLPAMSPQLDGKAKIASTVSLVDGIGSGTNVAASGGAGAVDASGLSHRVHRKPKSLRQSSFTHPTTSQPLVSTENVNVTAIRGESVANTESDIRAKSAVRATMDRSRSVSTSSGSQRGTPVGSPSNPVPLLATSVGSSISTRDKREDSQAQQDEFHLALEEPMNGKATPSSSTGTRHGRSQSLASTMSTVTAPMIPSTPPSAYSASPGMMAARGSSTMNISPLPSRTNSNLSAAFNHHHQQQQQQQQQQQNLANGGTKPALAALNNATAAVKKWYLKGKTDLSPGLPPGHHHHPPHSPNSEIQEFLRGADVNYMVNHHAKTSGAAGAGQEVRRHISPLPPPEIPPPPPKRTMPIAVPKRKALPPPLLPKRNAPPSQQGQGQRRQANGGVGAGDTSPDDILVVAAPPADDGDEYGEYGAGGSSEESGTPPDEFMVSLDGNTIHHDQRGNTGGGGAGGIAAGLGLMLRSDRGKVGGDAGGNGSGNGGANGSAQQQQPPTLPSRSASSATEHNRRSHHRQHSSHNTHHQMNGHGTGSANHHSHLTSTSAGSSGSSWEQQQARRTSGGGDGVAGIGSMSVKKGGGKHRNPQHIGGGGLGVDEEGLWQAAEEAELRDRNGWFSER